MTNFVLWATFERLDHDSKNTLTTHISQGTIMVYYGVNKTLGFFFGEIEIHQP